MEARFSAFFHQLSSASRIFMPRAWMAKSIRVVVPPKAAARVPVSKSSLEVVPPKGMSRCVCTSMPPGSSSMPEASITRSAVSIGMLAAISRIRSPSIRMSAGNDFSDVTTVPFRMRVVKKGPLLKGYHGRMKLLLCAMLAACATCTMAAQTFSASPLLDQTVEQAIQEGRIPGAVLLIGHNGQIVHRKAYGKRALVPAPEPMTVDTIFDLASLTKVVATTSSLMKLFEEGRFRLNDRVTQYLPEFQEGKSEITIRNLFTHFSGMPPDVELNPPWSGY